MATVPAGPVSRPRRRFLRFSVRGLIVIVMGAGLGWVVRSARIQREAVQAITRAGGWVKYEWEWTVGNAGRGLPTNDGPGGKPWAPQWLVDLIGVDFFSHATNASLGEKGTDALLVQVGRLRRLQRLNVNQPPAQSLVYEAGRPSRLQRLSVGTSSVSDAGLAHLKGLACLSTLTLLRTQVTDAGVKELRQALPNLRIIQ
jgi:internalin A